MLVTPSFQEYPSGHAVVTNAAASVLAAFYGDDTSFTATSATMTTVQRSFTSFAQAVAQVENARVWGGIHFRTATIIGAQMGGEVADYVVGTHLLRFTDTTDTTDTTETNGGPLGPRRRSSRGRVPDRGSGVGSQVSGSWSTDPVYGADEPRRGELSAVQLGWARAKRPE